MNFKDQNQVKDVAQARIFGRVVAEDMSIEEFDMVYGGSVPTQSGTVATDTAMQCDW
ncbi:hypothetical protein ISP15_03105 [Dyella jejuensis]|uniref:Uncharacterized protein n=1 Tax=Dyella jejuensis TaxID=1432009 RepID=A0ABW8JE19_9GAMM